MIPTNVLNGFVKVVGLPENECFVTFSDLLKSLEQYLAIEIPIDNLSNVVISVQQPNDADKGKLWLRRASSGQFIGFYIYSGGVWVQISPAPNQVTWFYGDSREVSKGYRLIDSTSGIFTSSQFAEFVKQYISDPTNTYYVYYAAVFIGI